MGQLAGPRLVGEQHETIAEEDGVPEDEEGGPDGDNADRESREAAADADNEGSDNSRPPSYRHRRDNANQGVKLMTLHIDRSLDSGIGGVAMGQVSPASEARRGSMSPGRTIDNRCVM